MSMNVASWMWRVLSYGSLEFWSTRPATDGETETADQNSGLVDLHSRQGKGRAVHGDRPVAPPHPPTARAAAHLRVDPTPSSETGTVWGLRGHNLPRERKGVHGGKDRLGREREGTRR